MIRYEVLPHVGIGPVRLNMTRAESRAAMKRVPDTFRKGDSARLTDAYHASAFQVFFDEDDRVEYIELSVSEEFQALYKAVDVHMAATKNVVAWISKDSAYDPEDPELGHSYVFPSLDLAVWRSTDQDRRFATIGVGRKGYFSSP
jgi:hypothetical protein